VARDRFHHGARSLLAQLETRRIPIVFVSVAGRETNYVGAASAWACTSRASSPKADRHALRLYADAAAMSRHGGLRRSG
jgi:hypothetical protein